MARPDSYHNTAAGTSLYLLENAQTDPWSSTFSEVTRHYVEEPSKARNWHTSEFEYLLTSLGAVYSTAADSKYLC